MKPWKATNTDEIARGVTAPGRSHTQLSAGTFSIGKDL